MQRKPIAIAIALATLIGPAVAQAHPPGASMTFQHSRHHLPRPVRTNARSFEQGMGDVYSFGCQGLPLASASVVRVVVGSYDDPARWLDCAQHAQAAGYRILVGIQFDNAWSVGHDASRFQNVLSVYAPYLWAVAIGNEEELLTSGTHPLTGAEYASIWRRLEPIAAELVPHAIRVAVEASPWGLAFARDAVAAGLPGAQVLSAHLYPDSGNGMDPAAFAALARSAGLQAWATEGMCGPGAWTGYGCRSLAGLRRAGISLGLIWYVNPAEQAAAPTVVAASPATWSTV